jgi:regulator of sirC expression with transglutaminase-like and TPR domain
MESKELKALIALLDDEDVEISRHIESKILSLGEQVVPFLEEEWQNSLNPTLQNKLENLIHTLQFQSLKQRLQDWKNAGANDLLYGLWLVATYQYPEVSYEELKEKIDQLYYNIWIHLRDNLNPYDQVRIINYVLFDEEKFSANTKNFHSPANNMLNVVFESKKGNPISLCSIYILLAEKLKLPIYGVNLPNLFILIYDLPEKPFYINAFNRGLIFTKSDIDNYIAQLGLQQQASFYTPCNYTEIVKRIFRNLIVAYEQLGEQQKMNEVVELLEILSE